MCLCLCVNVGNLMKSDGVLTKTFVIKWTERQLTNIQSICLCEMVQSVSEDPLDGVPYGSAHRDERHDREG